MYPLYNDICYNSKIFYTVNLVSPNSADRVFFSLILPYYSSGKHSFCVFVGIDSNRYKKCMLYNRKTVQTYPLLMPLMGSVKFLYNSKFDFTANLW